MRNMLAAVMLFLTPALLSAAPEFKNDMHYRTIVPEQPGGEGKSVEVKGFFWYGCGHCNAFEPFLEKWAEGIDKDVNFVRVPAMFNRKDVIMHAQTYYALELIGAKPEIHAKIFHAMHVEKKRLRTLEEMEQVLAANGIDIEKFRKAIKSFAVTTSIRKAALLAENYNIRGVPAVAIDGKYTVGGLEAPTMIQVMDFLIDGIRKDKAEK